MEYQFKIQDPSNPNTTYIFEEIIQLVQRGDLNVWRGIYSWTTGKTLTDVFLKDPDIHAYIQNGRVELVIGLDAITSVRALSKLVELNEEYSGFNSRVFHNDISDLFHPKISHFSFNNGDHVLLVGSGNFTMTGLQTNIEAYSMAIGSAEEMESISIWDEFLANHGSRIREIDEEANEKARENRQWTGQRRNVGTTSIVESTQAEEVEEIEEQNSNEVQEIVESSIVSRFSNSSRVLVARVPRAGGRWRQIHYNVTVMTEFFRAEANSHQRIFLKEIRLDGSMAPDEVRPIVFSESNRNYKIEVSARPGESYPEENPPLIILRELGVRNFVYIMLLPGDDHYTELLQFTEDNESIGRGVKRVLTDANRLAEIWSECPLIHQS